MSDFHQNKSYLCAPVRYLGLWKDKGARAEAFTLIKVSGFDRTTLQDVITRPSKLICILKKAVIDLFSLDKCLNNNFKGMVCFQSTSFVWSSHYSCVLWIMVRLNHDDAVPSSERFLQLVRQWSVSDRPQCYTELTFVRLLHTPLHQTVQGWHVFASCSSHQGCKSGGIVTIHPTGSIYSQSL